NHVVKRIRVDKNLVKRHYSLTLLTSLRNTFWVPVTTTVPASSTADSLTISSTYAFSASMAVAMSVPALTASSTRARPDLGLLATRLLRLGGRGAVGTSRGGLRLTGATTLRQPRLNQRLSNGTNVHGLLGPAGLLRHRGGSQGLRGLGEHRLNRLDNRRGDSL